MKKITKLNTNIQLKKEFINEAQLDFFYLSSPAEIEKKLKIIGLKNYQPIAHSKIFLNISDLIEFKKNFQTIRI